MLILRRKVREGVRITHRGSGDVIDVWVNKVRAGGQAELGLEDEPNHFKAERAEPRCVEASL